MKSKLFAVMVMGAGLAATNSAWAYTTTISGATRSFTLDSTSFFSGTDDNADSLVSYGDDNITGNTSNGNIPAGWTVIRDNNGSGVAASQFAVTGSGANSGTFSILDGTVWNLYSNIAIGLKVGNAQKSPDWAIFQLEKFASAGIWSTNTPQGLSHYLVYAQVQANNPPNPVPLPGAFWLLGSGLFALLGMGRNKRVVNS